MRPKEEVRCNCVPRGQALLASWQLGPAWRYRLQFKTLGTEVSCLERKQTGNQLLTLSHGGAHMCCCLKPEQAAQSMMRVYNLKKICSRGL